MTSATKRGELLENHLRDSKGAQGDNTRDNSQFISAVFWILLTGALRCDFPPDYGDWKNSHKRFCLWQRQRSMGKLLEILIDEPNFG